MKRAHIKSYFSQNIVSLYANVLNRHTTGAYVTNVSSNIAYNPLIHKSEIKRLASTFKTMNKICIIQDSTNLFNE